MIYALVSIFAALSLAILTASIIHMHRRRDIAVHIRRVILKAHQLHRDGATEETIKVRSGWLELQIELQSLGDYELHIKSAAALIAASCDHPDNRRYLDILDAIDQHLQGRAAA